MIKVYKSLFTLAIVVFFTACSNTEEPAVSVETTQENAHDIKGLEIKPEGLSCKEITLSSGRFVFNEATFEYGKKLELNFHEVVGLTPKDGRVFPSMEVALMSASGDTLGYTEDMMLASKGYVDSSPKIVLDLDIEQPLYSGANYTLLVVLGDQNSDSKLQAKLDLEVTTEIEVESNGIELDEAYLYSVDRNQFITGKAVGEHENIEMRFIGLTGFENENIGMGMRIQERGSNKIFVNLPDVVLEEGTTPENLAAQFWLNAVQSNEPYDVELKIWDKDNPDHWIKLKRAMNVDRMIDAKK